MARCRIPPCGHAWSATPRVSERMLPDTAEVLFALLDEYNQAIRPLQGVALFLTAGVLMLALRSRENRSRLIVAILAAGWGWTGMVFHLVYFTEINFAAGLWRSFYPAGRSAVLERRLSEPDFNPSSAETGKLCRRRHLCAVSADPARDRLASRPFMDRGPLRPAGAGHHRGTHARPPDDARPPPAPVGSARYRSSGPPSPAPTRRFSVSTRISR
jgi:hypothetical protein